MAGPLPVRNLICPRCAQSGTVEAPQSNAKPRFTACKGAF